MPKTLLEEIAHQMSALRKEMARQLMGTCHHVSHNHKKPRNKDLERALYKLKQAAFENRKKYEIAKHTAESKGWL